VKNNLHNIASEVNLPLSNLPLDLPFGYLENFTPSILEKIKLEDFISKLPKQNVYTIPVNYFETFTVKTNHFQKARKRVWIKKIAAVAAILIVCIGVSLLLINTDNTDNIASNSAINNLPIEEVNSYIALHLDDFSNEQLINMSADNVTKANQSKLLLDINIQDAQEYLQQESIEEFL
jgi:hypothetical protein